ncbi:class I SAM-dependent methyltransferase [Leptospira sp. 201903071]|uniref:class I SAM-dependent methyltransferase n=1 Tax=Leptospira ainazelensis TaxID=2810034 RepID=UPI001965E79F|nr:class I SAM-dependent methyltransferase [Leptospira ainazelensis]MBM9501938.1 class I SAM-dependent methyltransferase [Leptospira ainazelensis]
MEKNLIKRQLLDLKIISEDTLEEYFPSVRDRNDISVLRCSKSGVIFLSRTDHINLSYYENKVSFRIGHELDRKVAIRVGFEDASRRAENLKNLILNKKWLDVGSGVGAVLDILQPIAKEVVAVELQENIRKELIKAGYKSYSTIEEVTDIDFDVITLFHVFEHLVNPIETLRLIKERLKKGGKVILEIPHAKDFLFDFLDCDSFKKFTFWSEHLILHTRESLRAFLCEAGFSKIEIVGVQRYPLANHLFWLKNGAPGGHHQWSFLSSKELDNAYENKLASLDMTDTLLAIAES